MMVMLSMRFFLVCCWLLSAAPFHCCGASKAVLPLEEAKLSLAGSVTTTTLQQQQEEEEEDDVVLDISTQRRRLEDNDDGVGNNNKPQDSNENEPIEEEEEEEEEDDEPNEEDMPPPIEIVNDPEENEKEANEEHEGEEMQEGSNQPPGDEEEEEEEDNYNENELKQEQGDEDETQTAEGDDFVNPQQRPPVRFQRPGADKARTYRTDSLTPETRAKLRKQLDENKAARRERHGFLKRERNEKQQQNLQQPPLRRPGQGQAATPENPRQGATDTMLAYQPGTAEFKQRRQEVLKKLEQKAGKQKARALELKWEEMDKRRAQNIASGGPAANGRNFPFTKALPKQKFVEKVPVVKRFVKKLGYEEALMLDTTLSFLHGLRYGVYKSSGPLTLTKKQALVDWFELLSISLPQEWGIHDILNEFRDNIESISQKELSLIELVEDKQKQMRRMEWSPACKQGKSSAMSGFACGFWKLLHVSTIGLAEHRGGKGLIESGIRNSKTRTFTPTEAADTMKNYIQHFYLCGDCAKQFVAEYDDCNLFSRCNRLADDSSVVTDDDWKEVGKWMWEVHNHINAKALLGRKEREKKRYSLKASTSEYDVIAALWPTVDMCSQCFNGDGSWDEDAVFLYLERTFWPPSVLDPQSARLLKFEDEFDPQGTGLTMILAFVGLILVVVMRQSLSKKGLDQTIIMARMARKAMVTKGSVGAKKRAV